MSNDIEFVATFDAEQLLLTRGAYVGFPDPPEWGLASRPAAGEPQPWTPWGFFETVPSTWQVPGEA